MELDINTILTVLALLFTMMLGWVVGNQQYQKVKKALDAFTQMMKEVNDALYDDKVTEEEFRKIWEKAKGFYAALTTWRFMTCDEVDRLKRRIDELEKKLCDQRKCCCDKCCKKCYPICTPTWVYPHVGYPYTTQTYTDYNGNQITYTVQFNSTSNTSP